jgi:hypothetical protein
VKARVDLAGLAQDLGARLRPSGGRFVGSCPMCGGGNRATRFEVKSEGWVCAVCCTGGDAIALVRKVLDLDFAGAVERLGGPRVLSAGESEKLAAERRAREAKERAAASAYRDGEIAACQRLWNAGRQPGPLLKAYWDSRGLLMPTTALIREAPEVGYFHGQELDERGREQPRLIDRTPAQLAAILDNAGQFCGLHITHLRADGAGKAEIPDPADGKLLPPKKMRGTKKGGHIQVRQPSGAGRRLFLGEGIETVAAVATELHRAGKLAPLDLFWAAGDLGNLGGPHAGTVAHPTIKTPAGRPQRVPNAVPALDGPAIALPAGVSDLILLGDGDSDPFLTQHSLERAKARYARAGRRIAIAMAPAGRDFNDLIKQAG